MSQVNLPRPGVTAYSPIPVPLDDKSSRRDSGADGVLDIPSQTVADIGELQAQPSDSRDAQPSVPLETKDTVVIHVRGPTTDAELRALDRGPHQRLAPAVGEGQPLSLSQRARLAVSSAIRQTSFQDVTFAWRVATYGGLGLVAGGAPGCALGIAIGSGLGYAGTVRREEHNVPATIVATLMQTISFGSVPMQGLQGAAATSIVAGVGTELVSYVCVKLEPYLPDLT